MLQHLEPELPLAINQIPELEGYEQILEYALLAVSILTFVLAFDAVHHFAANQKGRTIVWDWKQSSKLVSRKLYWPY